MAVQYKFDGSVIKLTAKDYERWRVAFPYLDNFDAELQRADDYYRDHPIENGKWFHRVSRWLAKENQRALAAQRDDKFGVSWW